MGFILATHMMLPARDNDVYNGFKLIAMIHMNYMPLIPDIFGTKLFVQILSPIKLIQSG